ncbi:DUF4153 domain-containing protein [Jiella mangrovi]|uniref:DUF4153 domain-containing protein n=1 Tax=Jiella mangrovi TaxID=2821407 RepID=A0ABS4BDD6_9HYPH|nr:DUF4153 domain-containing protein [Jiella mangrovi]MBP0614770.1 DUF4153 domain-containing protein [Jiella mangrovi]
MQSKTETDRPPRLRRWAGRFAGSAAKGAETALLRFPVASLAFLLFSVVSNVAVADAAFVSERAFIWLLGALYGAAAASIAATLAAEARGWSRIASQALAFGVAVVAGAAIYWGGRADNHLPALTAALTLAIPLAPFVARGGPSRFWTFTLWTSVGVMLAFLSVLLFVLGLSAIFELIRFLFEVGLGSEAYEHIYTTAFTLVGPLFAMGRLPRSFEDGPELADERLVGGVRLLVDWVAAPLALATAVLLHLYAAKIAIVGVLPKNEIGRIVIFYALFVLSLRVGAEPFLAGGAWLTRWFAKVWAPILIVPLALASYGIGLRIAAEGFTLQRYYVVLGILATVLVLAIQLVPRLARDIRVMTAIPVVLLALSAFGPWGASSVVGASQIARIVEEFGVRVPGDEAIVVRTSGSDKASLQQLRSRLSALSDADRLGDLRPYLDADLRERLQAALRSQTSWQALQVATDGLGADLSSVSRARGRSFVALKSGTIDIGGFDRAALGRSATTIRQSERMPGGEASSSAGAEDDMSFSLDGDRLVASLNGVSDSFALTDAIAKLPAGLFSAARVDSAKPVLDLKASSGRTLRLAVQRLVEEEDGRVTLLQFDAFYKAADWR